MKILKTTMLMFLLLLTPVCALSADSGYLRISLIEGDVQINTPDAGDWGPATMNGPVGEGDQIWVPQDGKVELQLNTGTYIRLNENSAFQVLSMDEDSTQFYLSQGNAYIYYDATEGSVIQIDTPDASTRAFDRATFRIDVSEQYTDIAVYKGYVETENNVGNTEINAGQMVSLGQDTDGELAPMGPSDDWETWNMRRNDRIFAGRGPSSNYLPAELRAYSNDLDDNGRWVQVPDYGYVWTPAIVIGASWSPYRNGRWIWRGGNYIWVGSEPWGWAPYHYGRWSFRANIGWFWVPPVAREVYWSPGYVAWVRTADYVAWVPLAPGEIYYGRGNYGRNSVNITNVNIKLVNVTHAYKNVTVNNGVTIVNRNTFATAAPRIVNVNQNIVQQKIFTRNNISVGAPEIKPTRESYFASARTISRAKLPPQKVRDIQVKQLKQSRPFIKEADKSVLNPGMKPKTLPVNTVETPRIPGKGRPALQRVRPEEKKPAVPEGGPAGRGERKQLRPEERKPVAPEGGPAPKDEKQRVKPVEKEKEAVPQRVPADRGEQQRSKPKEKKPAAPEEGPTPKDEKQQIKSDEKGKGTTPQGGPDRGEKQQLKPAEKKSAAPENGREKKDKKKPAELDESSQKDKKKQGEEEPER